MMEGLRVLVVDDERSIRRFLRVSLGARGYDVREAETGELGLSAVASFRPDLVILDLGLPDVDGVEVIRRLREWSEVPVIVLSVRDAEEQKVAALDAGANDYVTKPFGEGELAARIRAVLRTQGGEVRQPVFERGDLRVDLECRVVTLHGEPVSLSPIEYDLLRALLRNTGKVLTHAQIIRAVWGDGYLGERHLLQVTMSNLRRKIEPDPSKPRLIRTEPGVGYRVAADFRTGDGDGSDTGEATQAI
jgi:two-component system KDP operon response regulator KdpE